MKVRTGYGKVALLRAAAIVTAATVVGGLAAKVSASAPVPVSINVTVTQFFPTFHGVWSATGAINDSGTFSRTDLHLSGSVPNSPVVGALQSEFLFTGSHGTFTEKNEVLATTTTLGGRWEIESGTGAYAGATGQGVLEFIRPTISFTGQMSTAG